LEPSRLDSIAVVNLITALEHFGIAVARRDQTSTLRRSTA
jgi:hypothetical protein